MSDIEQYAHYFGAGMKVGVGIPMPEADVFRDWAIIHEVDEDLVSLQLSRDQLPGEASLHVGQIIDLRGGKEGAGYSCRAIIVSEGEEQEILLRLIGEIVTDELREYYRIDAFLPIKYYISDEQHHDILKSEWSDRCRQREEEEQLRKEQRWEPRFEPEEQDRAQSDQEWEEELDEHDEWSMLIPLAANISGGGIRLTVHERLEEGQYVPLEILVPTPQRIVEAVGQVVFAHRMLGDRESYNVALKFVFIEERDRDLIVRHIAEVQLKRIRQLRERYAMRDGYFAIEEEQGGELTRQDVIRNVVFGLVLLCVITVLGVYLHGYAVNHPKGEIEETFESGIRKYLERIGR